MANKDNVRIKITLILIPTVLTIFFCLALYFVNSDNYPDFIALSILPLALWAEIIFFNFSRSINRVFSYPAE